MVLTVKELCLKQCFSNFIITEESILTEEIRGCFTEEVVFERALNNEEAFFGQNMSAY